MGTPRERAIAMIAEAWTRSRRDDGYSVPAATATRLATTLVASLYLSGLVVVDASEHDRDQRLLRESIDACRRVAPRCARCGHTHAGPNLGWICVGCPCEERG